MMILKQIIIIPLLFLATSKSNEVIKQSVITSGSKLNSKKNSINYFELNKIRGMSINLYRIGNAEKLEDVNDIEIQIAKTFDTKVDLYKITQDLAIIFLNTTDPYRDVNSIPFKMLYGKQVHQSISIGEIGGFLPSSDIEEITKWIKINKIETFAGFSKMYDNLSSEVKQELEEIGSEDKVSLFNGYVRPLVVLYFTALENKNSVVFVGQ